MYPQECLKHFDAHEITGKSVPFVVHSPATSEISVEALASTITSDVELEVRRGRKPWVSEVHMEMF